MKKSIFMGSLLLIGLLVSLAVAAGKDIVINDGFELREVGLEVYWTLDDFENSYVGPLSVMGVKRFDVKGDGNQSFAFYATPYVDYFPYGSMEGSLVQQIYVEAGQTYRVSADICYYNC